MILLQEHADPVFRGLVEYVVGSSELDEHSLVEEDDAVGDVAGEAHSVGDAEHGRASASPCWRGRTGKGLDAPCLGGLTELLEELSIGPCLPQ